MFSPNAGKYGPEITPYLDTSSSGRISGSRVYRKSFAKVFRKHLCGSVFLIELQGEGLHTSFAEHVRTTASEIIHG